MWNPKIKKMNLFVSIMTFGWADGITLAPFGVYLKEKYLKNKRIINHETIHWKQQMEMMILGAIIALLSGIILLLLNVLSLWLLTLLIFPFLFFYIWYLVEWGVRLITNTKSAYRSISFEREAYGNEYDMEYLKTRKPFAWLKYIV